MKSQQSLWPVVQEGVSQVSYFFWLFSISPYLFLLLGQIPTTWLSEVNKDNETYLRRERAGEQFKILLFIYKVAFYIHIYGKL